MHLKAYILAYITTGGGAYVLAREHRRVRNHVHRMHIHSCTITTDTIISLVTPLNRKTTRNYLMHTTP